MVSNQETTERVPKKPGVVPVVEPPFQFIQVGIQVLNGNLVVGADDRPLQQRPDILNGVGVNITPSIFFDTVVNRLMPSVFIGDQAAAQRSGACCSGENPGGPSQIA